MSPDEYCQDVAARSGSSFYQSFQFLSDKKRRAITALYAFCREIDDIVDECREPDIARTKLAWWRCEVDLAYEGKAQHPVTRALEPAIDAYALPLKHFDEIIQGMEMDLYQATYPDFESLKTYCYFAASTVGLLAARIFGYQNNATLEYAHDLGIAFQLTNILRDVHEDALRGRIYLPQDKLIGANIGSESFKSTHTTGPLRQLLKEHAATAEQYYEMAFSKLPAEDRWSQRCGLIMAELYSELLKKIIRNNFNVLEKRITLNPLNKMWIAWKTARREFKSNSRLAQT